MHEYTCFFLKKFIYNTNRPCQVLMKKGRNWYLLHIMFKLLSLIAYPVISTICFACADEKVMDP